MAEAAQSNRLVIGGNNLPTLGKYRLVAEIGHGGMAEVYLAVMEGPGHFSKLIALKVLRAQFAEDPEGRTMFLDEARLAARLAHPNIVQTYEIGEEGKRLYIAMEYLEGQPYSRILHRSRAVDAKPLPLGMTLRIIAESLAGLHHAHELKDFDGEPLKLVHRDISPHNVFVTYDGTVKVLDFGIAKAVGGGATTRTGVLKGKVGYMAPEQIFDDGLDRRADVYSAGVMLWEAIAGRRLWQGTNDVAILTKVANEHIPGIRSVKSDVPDELSRICMKAVARKRDERYSTAQEFQNDLEAFIDSLPDRALPRDVGKYTSETFATLRTETRAMIDTQLSKAKGMSPSSVSFEISALPTSSGSNPSMRSGDASLIRSSSSVSISVAHPEQPIPEAKKGNGAKIAIGGVVVAAAIAAGAYFAFSRNALAPAAASNPAPSSQAAPVTTPAEGASAPVPAATAPQAIAPAMPQVIEITVKVVPSDAKLFFDDEALPTNPATKKLAQDGSRHSVRAEAAGYESESEKVTLDGTKDVVLTLKKSTKPATGGFRPAAPPPATTTATAPPPPETAAPPPPPPPTATVTAPPTSTKPVHKIDTSNPFEQH